MSIQSTNPALSMNTRRFFVLVGLVVIFGSGLLWLPDVVRPRWPWNIAPFNSGFLGAIYLTELAIVVIIVLTNHWLPGRLILPMSLVFTATVSIVTLFYLDKLIYDRIATPAWFLAYFGSMFITAYFLWKYRNLWKLEPGRLPPLWHWYLLIQGVALVLFGIGLLILPDLFSGYWPWKIDIFHSQVYSAVFLSGGVGSLILYKGADRSELFALGLTQFCLGFFTILGLLIVDGSYHRVSWDAFGTWLWLVEFGGLFISGLAMIWYARLTNRTNGTSYGVSGSGRPV